MELSVILSLAFVALYCQAIYMWTYESGELILPLITAFGGFMGAMFWTIAGIADPDIAKDQPGSLLLDFITYGAGTMFIVQVPYAVLYLWIHLFRAIVY